MIFVSEAGWRQRRTGIDVYDDGGERRAIAVLGLDPSVPQIMVMPVMACLGEVGGESSRGDRDKPKEANPQSAQSNQVCPNHELSRPIFCLDHRFVRPNYARRPTRFPCS